MEKRWKYVAGVFVLIVVLAVVVALAVTLTNSGDDSDSSGSKGSNTITVKTDCGDVEGIRTKMKSGGSTVYTFRNIPYAVPPVGDLRWRPPILLSKDKEKCWNGTLKYTQQKIACMQPPSLITTNTSITEDCLILTIRTPKLDKHARLPVLVWIHGGSMIIGHGEQDPNYYPNEETTAALNVVSVSINYRLNVFGFLSLKELWITNGTSESYANYGVMDQIAALKWVRNNIENFGGDPARVTVTGESGGGTAVFCLLASPLARPLFRKAIPSSAAPIIKTSHIEADTKFRTLLNATSCNATEARVACLQNASAENLLTAYFYKVCAGSFSQYNSGFPENNKLVPGCPINVIDPKVVLSNPSELPTSISDKKDVLITNMAEESSPIPESLGWPDHAGLTFSNWSELNATISQKVDTFKKDFYPKLLAMYTTKSENKTNPIAFTPSKVYYVLSTDIFLSCANHDAVKAMSRLPGFTVRQLVISQPPSIKVAGTLGVTFTNAFHGWDSYVLFMRHSETLPPFDAKLFHNVREIYKDFVHLDSKDIATKYDAPAIEFWNGTVYKWKQGYHYKECNALRDNGFLKFAWGGEGKN